MSTRIQRAMVELIRWLPASWLTLGLVVLGGFGLRVFRLDAQSLWWDEGFSLELAGQSLGTIIHGDFHPPLYHLLLAGWVRLAGTSDFAARYLSVMFGTLLIPLTFCVGRRLFDSATGRVAALLVAVSPAPLWYSQETRMYILAALIYLTLIWLFHRLTDPKAPPPSARWWIAFALVELAGLYTHYFIALGIAWLLVAMLLRQHATRNTQYAVRNTQYASRLTPHASHLKPLLLTQAFVALAYLPWLPVLFSLQGRYRPVGATAPPLTAFVNQVWHGYNAGSLALVGHHATFMIFSTAAGVLFAVSLTLALIRNSRRDNLLWLLGHTLVPLTAVFALMQIRPFFHPRYVVMLAAPLLLLVARVITNLQSFGGVYPERNRGTQDSSPISNLHARNTQYAIRSTSFAILLMFLLTFATAIHAFTTDARYQRDDLRGLAEHLAATAGPEDAIVFGYVDYPFRRYYAGPASALYLNLSQADHTVAQTLASGLQGRKQAFLVTWNQAPVDRRGLLGWLMASAGRRIDTELWGDLTIHTYALDRSVPTPALVQQVADFGAVQLVGVYVPRTMPAAGAVPVAMAWKAPEEPPADYKVALRLRDARGHVLGRADLPLVNQAGESTSSWGPGTEATSYATLLLPLGTLPGVYSIDLVVYEAATLQSLDRQDAPGHRVDLGKVQLTPSNARFEAAPLPGYTAVDASMGNLVLEGYSLDRREAGPGGRLSVALRWRVADALQDGAPVLQLISGEATLAEAGGPLLPPSGWRKRQVVLDWRDLAVPPAAPSGPATLQVTVGNLTHVLAEVAITTVDRQFEVPFMAHAFHARFGGVAELLGYDLDTRVPAGEPVELTLYWRALGTSDIAYTVFTHLLNGDGRLVGQHDGVPAGGQRPTTGWLEGEIIVDRHRMTFKEAGYTGIARIEIGLYDPITGQRLTTAEGADHVILPATVRVVR